MTFFKRKAVKFTLPDAGIFQKKLVKYLAKYNTASMLLGGQVSGFQHKKLVPEFDILAGLGEISSFSTHSNSTFNDLQNYAANKNDIILGCLGYDLKNELENLHSENKDNLGFPELYFFQPEYIIIVLEDSCTFYFKTPNNKKSASFLFSEISKTQLSEIKQSKAKIIQKTPKDLYLKNLKAIQKNISLGNIYEMNYCIEFFAKNPTVYPEDLFQLLYNKSAAPFSFYLKFNGNYVLSASPERFLKKKGTHFFSQPMKGTIKRGKTQKEDKTLLNQLLADQKERAENIMITDLVRNDLSQTAKKGTVNVNETCGVYPFEQVFQMISTISGRVKKSTQFTNIIKKAFPPGSMTGAPKVRAMQIAETYENFKRSFYSGIAGYILPNGDFDFNVLIRSFLYNSNNKYLTFSAGGAITAKSIPEKEYQECLLKIEALKLLFTD